MHTNRDTESNEMSYMSVALGSKSKINPDREVRLSWMFFGSTFIAFILNGIWTISVGTASFGADESELIQGWKGVFRNIPSYLLLVTVASLSVLFAAKASVHGSRRAKSVLIASLILLLFTLSSVTRDAAEVIMTTRAATMAWLTFGVDAILVGLVYLVTQQKIRRALGQ